MGKNTKKQHGKPHPAKVPKRSKKTEESLSEEVGLSSLQSSDDEMPVAKLGQRKGSGSSKVEPEILKKARAALAEDVSSDSDVSEASSSDAPAPKKPTGKKAPASSSSESSSDEDEPTKPSKAPVKPAAKPSKPSKKKQESSDDSDDDDSSDDEPAPVR